MSKIWSILLIGTLSMLFAEVLSGASQMWYISPAHLLIAFPLYMFHLLFFLWIAFKTKRTNLSQLYLLGVFFGLYESWITKVLWAGYMNEQGPNLGTFLGLAIGEFPIIALFWHAFFAFIIPILVYEIITGQALMNHQKILKKSKLKTAFSIIILFVTSAFIANGNAHNLITANLSFIITVLMIIILSRLNKHNLTDFKFKNKWFISITAYLILLYIITFVLWLPERIPKTIIPYISILSLYSITLIMFRSTKKEEDKLSPLKRDQYSRRDLIRFASIMIIFINMSCIIPTLSIITLTIAYIIMSLTGIIIFIIFFYKTIKNRIERLQKKD